MKFNTGSLALLLSFVFQIYGKGYLCEEHFVVREGDTCRDATTGRDPAHAINIKYLMEYNPTIDCDHLKVGDKICFHDYKNDYNNEVAYYTIQESDTYQGIAEKLGTTVEILGNLNPTDFQYRLGDKNIKKQVGNEIIYRKDGYYLPDFEYSEEYLLPKHGNTNTIAIPTSTSTKKRSTKKTSTKKTSTKKTSTKKSSTRKSSTKKSSTKKSTITKTTTKKRTTKTSTKASPTSNSEYRCEKHVVVKHGDTCYKIYKNKKVNISYDKLKKLNPKLNCDDLRKNSKVCVSSSKASNNKSPNFDDSKQISIH